jgi:hypothetical protein
MRMQRRAGRSRPPSRTGDSPVRRLQSMLTSDTSNLSAAGPFRHRVSLYACSDRSPQTLTR